MRVMLSTGNLCYSASYSAQHRSRFIWTSVASFAMSLCGLIYCLAPVDYKLLSLIIILALLSLFPFIYGRKFGKINYLEIIYPLCIFFFISYPLRAFFIITQPEGFAWASPSVRYEDYLEIALIYSILGFGLFLLGYYTKLPEKVALRFPKFKLLENQNISIKRVVMVYAFGWLFRIISLRLGYGMFRATKSTLLQETGGFNYYIVTFCDFALYGLCLAVLIYYMKANRRKKTLYALLCYVMFSLEILYALIFVAKSYLIIPLFILAIAYNFGRKPIRISGRLLIIALLVIFLIFPVINFYRANFLRLNLKPPETLGAVVYNTHKVLHGLSSFTPAEYVRLSINFMINRMVDIDKFCAVIKFTPIVRDYQYGKDWVLIPALAYIPRLIWPTKPIVNYSVSFGRDYLWLTSGISLGTGNPGDFYMNFGLLGLLLGMFLLGILFRFVYLYLTSKENVTLYKILLYTFLMWEMINGFEGNIANIYSGVLKMLLFLVLILWFVTISNESYNFNT